MYRAKGKNLVLKVLLIFCALHLGKVATFECGVRKDKISKTIVRGQGTSPGDWPWHAAVYHREGVSDRYACGGSLITSTFVLTADHCVRSSDGFSLVAQLVFVRLGVYDLRELDVRSLQQHNVYKIYPFGESEELRNDIALMELKTVVQFTAYVQPVCLNQVEDLTKQYGTAIGWGFTEKDERSPVLRSARMPVISTNQCLASDRDVFGPILDDSLFCAGYKNGTTVCNGDSGGGIHFERNGIWYIGGIVSFTAIRDSGFLCSTKGYAGFSNVYHFLPWIQAITNHENSSINTPPETPGSYDADVRNETFKSSWTRNGSIAPSHSKHSGLFPSVVIRRYEFVGEDPAERIQIIFSEFRLPSRLEPTECGEMDILLVYFKVDGRDEVVETLCGDTLPKPILSNGPWLMLEFRSTYNNTENKGFTADFSFVTNFGVTTGYQPNKTDCSFHYFKNASNQGWIQSPNFPGAYPRNIRCNYFFYADQDHYVLIRFTYFDIEGILPCDENTASDTVEFSNFLTRDRKYGLCCGARRDLLVLSDGRFFRVTLTTNDRLDGTGFRALYSFESSNMAAIAQGPGSGVVRVLGDTCVPYLSHHQYHNKVAFRTVPPPVTTERSAPTVKKMGRSGASGRRIEICTSVVLWLVFVTLSRSQLATAWVII